jgi:glycine/D-amino acid oxidase-like deaminating enzyme/nitrite reductase/ring-hydroxylating ferredoxin subunit
MAEVGGCVSRRRSGYRSAVNDDSAVNASLWVATTPETDYPRLEEDVSVDVAVLGGGITGLTAAYLLKNEGKTVALAEAKRIVCGVTGYTTAKLTVGHNLVYRRLVDTFGEDGARTYAASNHAAIERVAQLVDELRIDCDFERASNFVYTESADHVDAIREEVAAAGRAGVEAHFTTETDLPFPILGAARVDGQAQFHPRKYLLPLAATLPGDGSHVFERTRARDVEETDGRCTVVTDSGRISAEQVVVATHLPFLDRGLFFVKAHPAMSYAIAAEVSEAAAPRGMYISIGQPTRSIRSTLSQEAERRILVVGGEGHRPGLEEDTQRRYEALEGFLAERFEAHPVAHRWSAHDYTPLDGVPYIGKLRRGSRRVYAATGFAKWGLTKGTLAAMLITDAILGRANPWAEFYDAKRLKPLASARTFAKENGQVALHFVGARLKRRETLDEVDLEPNEGRIVRLGRRHVAMFRDEGGAVHALSARCTHLGCLVEWNTAERTWDCPCHGSRFARTGAVIEGPAVSPLRAVTPSG